MRRWAGVVAAVWILGSAARAWAAEPIHELWRSATGIDAARCAPAVDPRDGSLWAREGGSLIHVGADGTVVFRSDGLSELCTLAVDPSNGSCWALEAASSQLLHFAAAGKLLSTTPDCPSDGSSTCLSPSPADGSVWVTARKPAGGFVAHVDALGHSVWRSPWPPGRDQGFAPAVVDPKDGSAWVLDGAAGAAVHLSADGEELLRVPGYTAVYAQDSRDQSVWCLDTDQALVRLSASGAVAARASGAGSGLTVAVVWVSPVDGSAWVCCAASDSPGSGPRTQEGPEAEGQVVELRADGTQVGVWTGRLVGCDAGDGSAWLSHDSTLTHLSAAGEEMSHFDWPPALGSRLAFSPAEDLFWATDGSSLEKVGPDGALLRKDAAAPRLCGGSWVDARDGSSWTRRADNPEIMVHFALDGTPLGEERLTDVWPTRVQISSTDGSRWVSGTIDGGGPVLVRLAPDGTELWRREGSGKRCAVDEADGSSWTTDEFWSDPDSPSQGRIAHFSVSGTLLWTQTYPYPLGAIAVDTSDHSALVYATDGATWCKLLRLSSSGRIVDEIVLPASVTSVISLTVWLSDGSITGGGWCDTTWPLDGRQEARAFRLKRGGEVEWVKTDLTSAPEVAVNATDGSAWLVDTGEAAPSALGSAVMHLASDGSELWRGTSFSGPTWVELDPVNGLAWVADSGNDQLVHIGVPLGPFRDVAADYWAVAEIEACLKAGIVRGFPNDTYRPTMPVTRDQMAAYVGRALAGGDDKIPSAPATASFPDVATDAWAFPYIEYCWSKGVVTGYPDGLYHPTQEVTRAQMAVYIARCFVSDPPPPADAVFPDVPADYWAAKYILYCKEKGVVQGYGDGTYRPEDAVTRAQMAVYVSRAFEL